jgi:hypothetical protein
VLTEHVRGAIRSLPRAGLVALVALQAGDIVTTLVGLARGATETGPIAGAALNAYGIAGLIFAPLAVVAVQLVVLAIMPRQFRRAGWAIVLLAACVPVANNLAVIAGQ